MARNVGRIDQWLVTAVKPRLREKTCQDYEGMLRVYNRPTLRERVLADFRVLELQTIYQQMIESGLSPRLSNYTHGVLRSAMRQAVQWRLSHENPAHGLKLPRQPQNEMQVLPGSSAPFPRIDDIRPN